MAAPAQKNSKRGLMANQHCQTPLGTRKPAEVYGQRIPFQQPPNSLPELFQVADCFFLPAML